MIFMKDISIPKENKISFESCCIVDGQRWFFANEFNALCSMDESNEITFKGSIPGESDNAVYLVADIKYYDRKLFLRKH